MKIAIALGMATVLALFLCSAAVATTVGWSVSTSGASTIYTYNLTSSELNDLITAFHIYAPLSPSLVSSWTAPGGWLFQAQADPEAGGTDLCWYAVEPFDQGLGYGQSLSFSMKVPAWTARQDNYVVPGDLGNWGYETYNYAGWGVLVSFPSVPVPSGQAAAPEPAGLLAVASAFALVLIRRRK